MYKNSLTIPYISAAYKLESLDELLSSKPNQTSQEWGQRAVSSSQVELKDALNAPEGSYLHADAKPQLVDTALRRQDDCHRLAGGAAVVLVGRPLQRAGPRLKLTGEPQGVLRAALGGGPGWVRGTGSLAQGIHRSFRGAEPEHDHACESLMPNRPID